jgi:hypothetical protein
LGFLGIELGKRLNYEGIILILISQLIIKLSDDYTISMKNKNSSFSIDNSTSCVQKLIILIKQFENNNSNNNQQNNIRDTLKYAKFHKQIMSLLEVLLFWTNNTWYLGKQEKKRIISFRQSIVQSLVNDCINSKNVEYMKV